MKNINNDVFLTKINERIMEGDFDVYLIFPFMSRDLLYANIKNKIAAGGHPILSDPEIKTCIAEVKETALYVIALYLKLGFIEKTKDGYEFTRKGQIAIKAARTL